MLYCMNAEPLFEIFMIFDCRVEGTLLSDCIFTFELRKNIQYINIL